MVDVAYKRPAKQSSTRSGKYQASNAVDGEEDCAQTRNEPDPWWRVDLGKSVWVESVEIASRTDLSDVDIRIGKASNHWLTDELYMLCMVCACTADLQDRDLQGLSIGNRTVLTVLTSLLNSPRIKHVLGVDCMKLSHGRSFHYVILLIACV